MPQWLLKLIGKKIIDNGLEKHNISKAKVAGVLGLLVPLIEQVSEMVGHPFKFPPNTFEILGAFGLWALRDGIKS